MKLRYRIYQLSARTVMSYAKQNDDGEYIFELTPLATEKSKAPSALHEQEDNALFYQIMCELHGNNFEVPEGTNLITDLSDVICYIDFAGIFDRNNGQKKYSDRQLKARDMFRPCGIKLDFGTGSHRYVAFERSASMSRSARLSFIRADLYDNVRRRIMMDMDIGVCQLSKLYAYKGLMLSGGTRIDGIDIEKPHRVIVVDNQNYTVSNVPVVTVKDETGSGSIRKYSRVETTEDIKVVAFDGEGLISKQYAFIVDKAFCGKHIHHSFQIRLPFVKGMLHEVDYKDLLASGGTEYLIDIWGNEHKLQDVDIILTKSMFKGFDWLMESKMTWDDYWESFRKYNHGLYITNVGKEKPEEFTELNYQFLITLSLTTDEFRPKDLPFGWNHSPSENERHWLTKQTEIEYYGLCNDKAYRQNYFLKALSYKGIDKKSKPYLLAEILKRNPLFINESIYAKELEDKAENLIKRYSLGNLIVAGDNRFLSADLLEFIYWLRNKKKKLSSKEDRFDSVIETNKLTEFSFHAPSAKYMYDKECTLLRSPHLSRNEETILKFHLSHVKRDNMRNYYFGKLTDVAMVAPNVLAAERMGGADYDGDMIKTISEPIVIDCVRRNLEHEMISHNSMLPLLQIPTVTPLICDSTDWEARFETVKNTFSSRVGQISNAAFDRSVIAYNENSDSEERKKCREETEMLTILTGLEIDSAKSGVKPDLSEYLGKSKRKRSLFLEYKYKLEKLNDKVPGAAEKLKQFFESVDWDAVDSNVERLPYIAKMLKENTPRIKPVSSKDSELFSFAEDSDWKKKLDKNILNEVKSLISEYDKVIKRIQIFLASPKKLTRKSDIERILYSQGKENEIDVDILYAAFSEMEQEFLFAFKNAIKSEQWHFMDDEDRRLFLYEWIPELSEYFNILCDFRNSGFRILGDLVLDTIRNNEMDVMTALSHDSDSENISEMVNAYLNRAIGVSYRDAVAAKCREILDEIVNPVDAVKYVVALGKRNFMWDVLLDAIKKNVLKRRNEV